MIQKSAIKALKTFVEGEEELGKAEAELRTVRSDASERNYLAKEVDMGRLDVELARVMEISERMAKYIRVRDGETERQ